MLLVQIEGPLRKINKTLMNLCESGCIHVVPLNHTSQDEASQIKQLKTKSSYNTLVSRFASLAEKMQLEVTTVDYEDVGMNVSVDFANYLNDFEEKYKAIADKIDEIEQNLRNHSLALMQVEQVTGFEVDFEELYACKYIKMRFGKLPADSLAKLSYYEDMDFELYRFHADADDVWVLYLAPNSCAAEVDEIFNTLFFERVRFPEYFRGNGDEVKSQMLRTIMEETSRLDELKAQLSAFTDENGEYFLKVYNKVNAIAQSYELRQNAQIIHRKFYISGFVPKRKIDDFRKLVEAEESVIVKEKPIDNANGAKPPVLLRNNWVFRPFEMFIKMYGLPDYKGFDPTPYVAVTFMLIFGIMFGDLGQGIIISLFGLLLDKLKHAKLAKVMERIGVTSALFGILYGSVFGNEEIITPFFKQPAFYKLMGMSEAPEDIFQVSTILLIAAVGIGAILILISMAMNIVTCFRNRAYGDALISPNGVSGVIFYFSLVLGAAFQLGFGIEMFTAPYVLGLIVLPIVLLFFKEPIVSLFEKLIRSKRKNTASSYLHAVKSYSDAVSELGPIVSGSCRFDDLIENGRIKMKYGLLPANKFEELAEDGTSSFIFYPFEEEGDFVTGVCISSDEHSASAEKTMSEFGFRTAKMPEHIMDIRKENTLHIDEYIEHEKPKNKKTVGSFIIEGIIELFESCLSYITNTMSFLRIGGFILSHAGMMLVVSVIAGNAGDSIIVYIIGNIVVIGMEGFLVGIQALRLEFYEIFSRFYKGSGTPFNPVAVNFNLEH